MCVDWSMKRALDVLGVLVKYGSPHAAGDGQRRRGERGRSWGHEANKRPFQWWSSSLSFFLSLFSLHLLFLFLLGSCFLFPHSLSLTHIHSLSLSHFPSLSVSLSLSVCLPVSLSFSLSHSLTL